MKLSIISKPISSPGRADKFPPPIMRFLRSNAGSRSRGRSRSSPMFIRKLKAAAGSTIETTQEPTSPKVTCMGQVRVRRSGAKQSRRSGKIAVKRRQHWIRDALLCHRVRTNRGSKSSRHVSLTRFWRKWASCCHLGCGRRPTQRRQDSEVQKADEESKSTNWERRRSKADEDEFLEPSEEDRERLATARLYAIAVVAAAATTAADSSTSPCSPPKNALLLTRCKSAPYRSSSLACRFWGSPLKDANADDERNEVHLLSVNEDVAELSAASDDADESSEQPKKNSNVSSRSSDPESRVHPENEEIERYLNETETEGFVAKPLKLEEQKLMEGRVVVRLERCKSEPARTAGKKLGFR